MIYAIDAMARLCEDAPGLVQLVALDEADDQGATPTATGMRHSRKARNFSVELSRLSTMVEKSAQPRKRKAMPLPRRNDCYDYIYIS